MGCAASSESRVMPAHELGAQGLYISPAHKLGNSALYRIAGTVHPQSTSDVGIQSSVENDRKAENEAIAMARSADEGQKHATGHPRRHPLMASSYEMGELWKRNLRLTLDKLGQGSSGTYVVSREVLYMILQRLAILESELALVDAGRSSTTPYTTTGIQSECVVINRTCESSSEAPDNREGKAVGDCNCETGNAVAVRVTSLESAPSTQPESSPVVLSSRSLVKLLSKLASSAVGAAARAAHVTSIDQVALTLLVANPLLCDIFALCPSDCVQDEKLSLSKAVNSFENLLKVDLPPAQLPQKLSIPADFHSLTSVRQVLESLFSSQRWQDPLVWVRMVNLATSCRKLQIARALNPEPIEVLTKVLAAKGTEDLPVARKVLQDIGKYADARASVASVLSDSNHLQRFDCFTINPDATEFKEIYMDDSRIPGTMQLSELIGAHSLTGGISESHAAWFMRQILTAVAQFHSLGLTHGSITLDSFILQTYLPAAITQPADHVSLGVTHSDQDMSSSQNKSGETEVSGVLSVFPAGSSSTLPVFKVVQQLNATDHSATQYDNPMPSHRIHLTTDPDVVKSTPQKLVQEDVVRADQHSPSSDRSLTHMSRRIEEVLELAGDAANAASRRSKAGTPIAYAAAQAWSRSTSLRLRGTVTPPLSRVATRAYTASPFERPATVYDGDEAMPGLMNASLQTGNPVSTGERVPTIHHRTQLQLPGHDVEDQNFVESLLPPPPQLPPLPPPPQLPSVAAGQLRPVPTARLAVDGNPAAALPPLSPNSKPFRGTTPVPVGTRPDAYVPSPSKSHEVRVPATFTYMNGTNSRSPGPFPPVSIAASPRCGASMLPPTSQTATDTPADLNRTSSKELIPKLPRSGSNPESNIFGDKSRLAPFGHPTVGASPTPAAMSSSVANTSNLGPGMQPSVPPMVPNIAGPSDQNINTTGIGTNPLSRGRSIRDVRSNVRHHTRSYSAQIQPTFSRDSDKSLLVANEPDSRNATALKDNPRSPSHVSALSSLASKRDLPYTTARYHCAHYNGPLPEHPPLSPLIEDVLQQYAFDSIEQRSHLLHDYVRGIRSRLQHWVWGSLSNSLHTPSSSHTLLPKIRLLLPHAPEAPTKLIDLGCVDDEVGSGSKIKLPYSDRIKHIHDICALADVCLALLLGISSASKVREIRGTLQTTLDEAKYLEIETRRRVRADLSAELLRRADRREQTKAAARQRLAATLSEYQSNAFNSQILNHEVVAAEAHLRQIEIEAEAEAEADVDTEDTAAARQLISLVAEQFVPHLQHVIHIPFPCFLENCSSLGTEHVGNRSGAHTYPQITLAHLCDNASKTWLSLRRARRARIALYLNQKAVPSRSVLQQQNLTFQSRWAQLQALHAAAVAGANSSQVVFSNASTTVGQTKSPSDEGNTSSSSRPAAEPIASSNGSERYPRQEDNLDIPLYPRTPVKYDDLTRQKLIPAAAEAKCALSDFAKSPTSGVSPQYATPKFSPHPASLFAQSPQNRNVQPQRLVPNGQLTPQLSALRLEDSACTPQAFLLPGPARPSPLAARSTGSSGSRSCSVSFSLDGAQHVHETPGGDIIWTHKGPNTPAHCRSSSTGSQGSSSVSASSVPDARRILATHEERRPRVEPLPPPPTPPAPPTPTSPEITFLTSIDSPKQLWQVNHAHRSRGDSRSPAIHMGVSTANQRADKVPVRSSSAQPMLRSVAPESQKLHQDGDGDSDVQVRSQHTHEDSRASSGSDDKAREEKEYEDELAESDVALNLEDETIGGERALVVAQAMQERAKSWTVTASGLVSLGARSFLESLINLGNSVNRFNSTDSENFDAHSNKALDASVSPSGMTHIYLQHPWIEQDFDPLLPIPEAGVKYLQSAFAMICMFKAKLECHIRHKRCLQIRRTSFMRSPMRVLRGPVASPRLGRPQRTVFWTRKRTRSANHVSKFGVPTLHHTDLLLQSHTNPHLPRHDECPSGSVKSLAFAVKTPLQSSRRRSHFVGLTQLSLPTLPESPLQPTSSLLSRRSTSPVASEPGIIHERHFARFDRPSVEDLLEEPEQGKPGNGLARGIEVNDDIVNALDESAIAPRDGIASFEVQGSTSDSTFWVQSIPSTPSGVSTMPISRINEHAYTSAKSSEPSVSAVSSAHSSTRDRGKQAKKGGVRRRSTHRASPSPRGSSRRCRRVLGLRHHSEPKADNAALDRSHSSADNARLERRHIRRRFARAIHALPHGFHAHRNGKESETSWKREQALFKYASKVSRSPFTFDRMMVRLMLRHLTPEHRLLLFALSRSRRIHQIAAVLWHKFSYDFAFGSIRTTVDHIRNGYASRLSETFETQLDSPPVEDDALVSVPCVSLLLPAAFLSPEVVPLPIRCPAKPPVGEWPTDRLKMSAATLLLQVRDPQDLLVPQLISLWKIADMQSRTKYIDNATLNWRITACAAARACHPGCALVDMGQRHDACKHPWHNPSRLESSDEAGTQKPDEIAIDKVCPEDLRPLCAAEFAALAKKVLNMDVSCGAEDASSPETHVRDLINEDLIRVVLSFLRIAKSNDLLPASVRKRVRRLESGLTPDTVVESSAVLAEQGENIETATMELRKMLQRKARSQVHIAIARDYARSMAHAHHAVSSVSTGQQDSSSALSAYSGENLSSSGSRKYSISSQDTPARGQEGRHSAESAFLNGTNLDTSMRPASADAHRRRRRRRQLSISREPKRATHQSFRDDSLHERFSALHKPNTSQLAQAAPANPSDQSLSPKIQHVHEIASQTRESRHSSVLSMQQLDEPVVTFRGLTLLLALGALGPGALIPHAPASRTLAAESHCAIVKHVNTIASQSATTDAEALAQAILAHVEHGLDEMEWKALSPTAKHATSLTGLAKPQSRETLAPGRCAHQVDSYEQIDATLRNESAVTTFAELRLSRECLAGLMLGRSLPPLSASAARLIAKVLLRRRQTSNGSRSRDTTSPSTSVTTLSKSPVSSSPGEESLDLSVGFSAVSSATHSNPPHQLSPGLLVRSPAPIQGSDVAVKAFEWGEWVRALGLQYRDEAYVR